MLTVGRARRALDAPARTQSLLFADTGLFISSHSSQLVNMLFSQPRSAVVCARGRARALSSARN